MAVQPKKTLTFYHTLFESENYQNCEEAFRKLFDNFDNVKDIITYREQEIAISKFQNDTNRPILIDFWCYEKGQKAPIIPNSNNTDNDVDLLGTSEGEFLLGRASILLHKNNLCACTGNFSEGKLQSSLNTFIHQFLGKNEAKISLTSRIKKDVMSVLQQEGVQSVALGFAAPQIAQSDNDTGGLGLFGKVYSKENTEKIQDSNLQFQFKIKADGKNNFKIDQDTLMSIATNAMNDDAIIDDITIITKEGRKYKRNDEIIKEQFNVNKRGHTFDRFSAWKALTEFYEKLIKTKML